VTARGEARFGPVDLSGQALAAYTRWLGRRVRRGTVPAHVALIMDGNRRWARQMGLPNPSLGHRHGAEHLEVVLGWCADIGITHVTVFVASADNIAKRSPDEVAFLMQVTEDVIATRLAQPSGRWQVHLAGDLTLLPDSTRHALKLARDATTGRGDLHLTVAIGYDGRAEIAGAVRLLLADAAAAGVSLAEVAAGLTTEDIGAHLDTRDLPDPDLVIRTSGEQRMSDFLLWQSATSELYFCDVYWPGFRHVDFLRALRSYAARVPGSF
jgi:short-chain Z-isoprenyl diphosphate synthase